MLYGTDLGNGDQPVGVNPREVDALRTEAGVRRRRAASRALADPLDPSPIARIGRLHLRARRATRGLRTTPSRMRADVVR